MTTVKTYTSEKSVKRDVKKLLDDHGWFWWMTPANGFGKSGVSDFSAIKHGVYLAIETKFGKNKATPSQIGYLNSVRAESGFAFIVNEDSLAWLEVWLKGFDNATLAVASSKEVKTEDGADMLNAIAAMTKGL